MVTTLFRNVLYLVHKFELELSGTGLLSPFLSVGLKSALMNSIFGDIKLLLLGRYTLS